VRIRVAYTSHNLPVEIEIEGEALTPNSIPNILGGILKHLESWINMQTPKTHGEGERVQDTRSPDTAATDRGIQNEF